jgi:hypothetical protein
MVTKARRSSRKKKAACRDYLFVAENNVLVIVSGSTGKTRRLDAADTAEVLDLLKQRQKTGKELAALLKKLGVCADIVNLKDGN